MSHFFVIAIVPKNTEDIPGTIDKLMAPYSESLEVPPYQRKCFCVGGKARDDARKQTAEKFGNFDKLRDSYWTKVDSKQIEDCDINWNNHIKEWSDFEKSIISKHMDKDKPDPKCTECKGTGSYETTYNPKSKWDWYVIGGRWDGYIQNDQRDDGKAGFNFSDEHHQVQYNEVDIPQLIKNKINAFAILAPTGEWLEEGEMQFFGFVTDKKCPTEWSQECQNIYNKYKNDYIAIGLDCHI